MEKQEFKVKSLGKALRLLECFSDKTPELGITELAKMLGLQKSTVHNIVATYEAMGYVSKNKQTGKYFLGVKLLRFSYIINNHMGLRNHLVPYVKRIAESVNETVYLGIPHDGEVLYLDSEVPKSSLVSRNIMGEHAPMYCTGLGKAMLAFLPEEEQRKIVSRPLTAFTGNTITSREALCRNLEEVRQKGYAVDNMEHEYGITCVGVPIFGNDRQVVAAVSVSAPSLRLDTDRIEQVAGIVRDILKPIQYTL